jgi:hypothetical protein
MKVYQVLWYENDCSGTVSLHRSLEGAIKAIEAYKEKFTDWDWRDIYHPNDWTFGWGGVRIVEKDLLD